MGDPNLYQPKSLAATTYAIDAWIPDQTRMTGVQKYALQLIQAMKRQSLSEGERVVLFSFQPLVGSLAELPTGWEERVLAWRPQRGWMSVRVSWELLRRPPTVFFVPAQGLPIVSARLTVTTVHDIAFERRPDLYDPSVARRLRRVTKAAVKKATKIIVPSEATKQDMIDIYRVASDRITVTPLSADTTRFRPLEQAQIDPVLQKYRLGRNFFLSVGRLERKKNITTLLRAFESFKERRGVGDPFELVLAGTPGYGYYEIKKYLEFSDVKESIRTLGFVPEEDLPAILNAATAYVFPSWYEGFGIPNVEAMASGTPLITSDIPAHREVVGDAALLVSAREPDAWAAAMTRIAQDGTLRDELSRKGIKRAKDFSWDKTAQQTWAVLRSLV